VFKATNGAQSPEMSVSLHSDFFFNSSESDATAWARLRTSDDPASLRNFLSRFPDSPYADAAQLRLALITSKDHPPVLASAEANAATRQPSTAEPAPAPAGAATPAAPSAPLAAPAPAAPAWTPVKIAAAPANAPEESNPLPRLINLELRRVGCYAGDADAPWTSPAIKGAVADLTRYASLAQAPPTPSQEFLNFLKGQTDRICPLICPPHKINQNGQCVAKACNANEAMNSKGECAPLVAARPQPAPRKEAAKAKHGGDYAATQRPAAPAAQPAANSGSADNTGCMPVSAPSVSAYYGHDTWSSGLCK
jgi:hypothetical protein